MSEPGRQYAVALQGKAAGLLKLDLPKGRYSYEWIDPASGSVLSGGEVRSRGDVTDLKFHHAVHLLALRIRRR